LIVNHLQTYYQWYTTTNKDSITFNFTSSSDPVIYTLPQELIDSIKTYTFDKFTIYVNDYHVAFMAFTPDNRQTQYCYMQCEPQEIYRILCKIVYLNSYTDITGEAGYSLIGKNSHKLFVFSNPFSPTAFKIKNTWETLATQYSLIDKK
jgi:hypothetical protein